MNKTLLRIKNDYFSKSKLPEYKSMLLDLKNNGYSFVRICDYSEGLYEGQKIVLLRHDIDTSVGVARKMVRIEQNLGIVSTYYIRNKTLKRCLISDIKKTGSEIGYHYEEIATFCFKKHVKTSDDIDRFLPDIRSSFQNNFEKFSSKADTRVVTIASHGDFINRKLNVANNYLVDQKIRDKNGIIWEAYDAPLMEHFTYLPDCTSKRSNFEEVEKSIKNGVLHLYLLVHPRFWESSFSVIKEDINRIVRGIFY